MPRPTGAYSSSETAMLEGMRPVNQQDTKRPRHPRIGAALPAAGRNLRHMSSTLAEFLLPTGFECPRPAAVLREGSAVTEIGRYALRAAGRRRSRRDTPYADRGVDRLGDPVILVPG